MFGRIFLVMCLFILNNPSLLPAATEQRIALVIGNSVYSSGPLKNPVNDAADMAAMLKKLGFSVTLKKNASLQEMDEAIEAFGNRLKRGGVGLFYYAGHGVQVSGINYLLPIGARINKETDVKYQAVDANKILDEMATANNGLNIVMLDACRDNPFVRSFRSATRGLAIVSSAPSGTIISYSTSPGNIARDGDGRNNPYTAALLKYMQTPGLTIGDVFINVRKKVKKETGQVPWELSSLEGQFYFLTGIAGKSAATVPSGKATVESEELSVSTPAVLDDLDDENRKLEAEQRRMEDEKASFAKKRAMEEKRQKIAEEKARLEAEKLVENDGRFLKYADGTVLDSKTTLMWAARDNGSNINWEDAKSYCENYRGGGYTDWRMPTQDELAGLYDESKSRSGACERSHNLHVATELIDITCFFPWASGTRGSEAAYFKFDTKYRGWLPQSTSRFLRTLPVRFGM